VAFDFLYRQRVDSDGEPGGKLRSEPVRFSCALATVDGERPHVVIEPASAPLPDRAGGEPVRLEWGAFNARYRVISPDRGFAASHSKQRSLFPGTTAIRAIIAGRTPGPCTLSC